MINIFQPSLGQTEIDAVAEVIRSNWIGRGPKTKLFEEALSKKLNVSMDNVTTVSCCTNGMFEILRLLNLAPSDEVILPSLSFVGAANAVKAAGAKVVFADVDSRTLNLTPEALKSRYTVNTKAVLLIHYGGYPCNMKEIMEYCADKSIKIIEDNACSPFSIYGGKNTGTLADYGVWSFDSMKILSCGDGGLVYAKNTEDMEQLRKHLYLGMTTRSGMESTSPRWWEFDVSVMGDRHIMNDISAAIGLVQLSKVDGFIEKRKKFYNWYNEAFSDLPITLPPALNDNTESSYYLYCIFTENRDKLAKHLKDNGIYSTFRYYPLHKISKYGSTSPCPQAEEIAEKCLCLPLHQGLSSEDLTHVASTMIKFYDV